MKKVTMKNIAEMANVSVATVSYILNNVKNQSIPTETRERVLEIAKNLNYIPNLAARSLVKQKTGLVGILVNKDVHQGFWRNLQYAQFITELESLLTRSGYHVVLSSLDASNPNPQIILERKLDGVFLIDANEDTFYHISRQFIAVPLVVIDSVIDDPLFFKVMPDFESALEKAKVLVHPHPYFLVMEQFNNKQLAKKIKKHSNLNEDDIYMVKNERELALFLEKNKGKKGIVVNEFLGSIAAKYFSPDDLIVICNSECPDILTPSIQKIAFKSPKSTSAFEVMQKLIQNNDLDKLEKYILIGVN
ncbi:LacI family DNA-binding transcriptional regulator [Neobacillus sp. D3-1R]|uniref:LacI family DNA-binding transcriptional regulator n=1 Tax=Neobacillus sp. D3-1R TaxID=3445778 RepID=UPI003FA030DC